MAGPPRTGAARSPIAPAPRPALLWAAAALVLGTCYLLLCLADLLLARWVDHQTTRLNAEARAIEQRRAEQQDAPQLAGARREGYRTMLFPALFDSEPFRGMAEAQGVVPLAPQPSTRLLYCNEGGGLVRYRSDRFGLRNDDTVWDAPAIDIALIGDSYVQGACVGDGDTLAARLGAPARPVVNLGTAGNNAVHHAAVIKAFLPGLRPRVAVLVFYANDNEDEEASVVRSLAIDRSPSYVRVEGSRRLPGPAYQALGRLFGQAEAEAERQRLYAELPAAARPARPWPQRLGRYLALPHLRQLLGQAWQRWFGPRLAWSSRLAIDMLAQQCAQAGCQPVLAYIPNSDFWRPDARAAGYKAGLQAYAAAHHPSMRWVDASEVLAPLGRDAYASQGPHLSVQGYQAVAAQIDRRLPR